MDVRVDELGGTRMEMGGGMTVLAAGDRCLRLSWGGQHLPHA